MNAPRKAEREIGWPERLIDTRGMKVRLRKEVRNHFLVIPAGTCGTISSYASSWNRLEIVCDPCPCCGVKARCSQLSRADLEPIVDEPPLLAATQ